MSRSDLAFVVCVVLVAALAWFLTWAWYAVDPLLQRWAEKWVSTEDHAEHYDETLDLLDSVAVRAYERGVADERARCIAAVEALAQRATGFNTEAEAGIAAALAALRSNASVEPTQCAVCGGPHMHYRHFRVEPTP